MSMRTAPISCWPWYRTDHQSRVPSRPLLPGDMIRRICALSGSSSAMMQLSCDSNLRLVVSPVQYMIAQRDVIPASANVRVARMAKLPGPRSCSCFSALMPFALYNPAKERAGIQTNCLLPLFVVLSKTSSSRTHGTGQHRFIAGCGSCDVLTVLRIIGKC